MKKSRGRVSNFSNFIGSKETLLIAWDELNKTYRKSSFDHQCRNFSPKVSNLD